VVIQEHLEGSLLRSSIHIRSPCNDTCGECTLFQNDFCYLCSKEGKVGGNGKPTSDNEESQSSGEPFADNLVVDNIKTFAADDICHVDA
jgi:hypothetical protein